MGHSINCNRRRWGGYCDCGFEYPLADWERELLTGIPVDAQIRDRIKEIEDEIGAIYRLIGELVVNREDASDFVAGVNAKRGRIDELKNVLKMMEV